MTVMHLLLDALPDGPGSWIDLVTRIGPGGLLAVALWAFVTGRIVTKAAYDAVQKRCDALQAAADGLLKGYQDREAEERRWRAERPPTGSQGERTT